MSVEDHPSIHPIHFFFVFVVYRYGSVSVVGYIALPSSSSSSCPHSCLMIRLHHQETPHEDESVREPSNRTSKQDPSIHPFRKKQTDSFPEFKTILEPYGFSPVLGRTHVCYAIQHGHLESLCFFFVEWINSTHTLQSLHASS